MNRQIDRRDFLKCGLGGPAGWAAMGATSRALGQSGPAPRKPLEDDDPDHFVFARLKYRTLMQVSDDWRAHPQGDTPHLRVVRRAGHFLRSGLLRMTGWRPAWSIGR